MPFCSGSQRFDPLFLPNLMEIIDILLAKFIARAKRTAAKPTIAR
jgi:hypothetical protein